MKRKILDFARLLFKIRIAEEFLVKLTKGKEFGTLLTKLPPNHYQYQKESIRIVQRDGINFYLDISDLVDWYLYFGFSESSRNNLYQNISPGNTIIDVGANVGDTTLHIAKLIGCEGSVHSFEPDPINFKRLSNNVESNDFSNIVINNKGLGNVPGKFTIHQVAEGNKGMNRILTKTESTFSSSEIHVTTIDSYLNRKGITEIDLIKIDVEGYELNVLQGAREILYKSHPLLFIELDDNNLKEHNQSSKDLVEFLEELDYEFLRADTNEKITSSFDFSNCHFDIVAHFIPEIQ